MLDILTTALILVIVVVGFILVVACGLALIHVFAPIIVCALVAAVAGVLFGASSVVSWAIVGGTIGALWLVATRFRVLIPILLCAGIGIFFGWILGAFWFCTIIGTCGGIYVAAK